MKERALEEGEGRVTVVEICAGSGAGVVLAEEACRVYEREREGERDVCGAPQRAHKARRG